MTNKEVIECLKNKRDERKLDTRHVGEVCKNLYTKEIEALDMAIKALEQTKWIPVSERLPKYGKDVLTCDLGGFIEIQSIEYNVWDDYSYWENQKGDWTDFDEVTAWMPLPEPYNKSESEVQL